MEKISGQTLDIVKDNILKLKNIFPEVFNEDKVDLEKLSEILGEYRDKGIERYNFSWPGKSKAIRIAQTPSTGTLRPCREESKNWDKTGNLYIEGDNLEVLKLLQKSYYGKVKMIYIDPPYNTGNDFVYKDDFKDNLNNYLTITGQKDEDGNKISTNTESSGRYHSNWLNMMYPRLKLAKNLLKDDGVIFISIDDNEVHNLRKICNEIFGEENFIANFTWIKKKKGSHLSKTIRNMTEYILTYTKNINKVELFGEEAYSDKWQPLAKRTNTHKTLFFSKDIIETKLKDGFYKKGLYGDGTSALEFLNNFNVRKGIVIDKLKVNGPFVWTQNKLNEELDLGTRVSLSSKFGFNVLRSNQSDKVKRPTTILDSKLQIGTNEDAYNELINIFNVENIINYPKPVSLIEYIINTLGYYDRNLLILDFFSGSSTTAHSVIKLNSVDNGNRKYIMVQLPEYTDQKSEAYKSGYKNICEIGKERIRRAGEKIKEDNKDKEGIEDLDIGFKVFKLDSSNINKWDSSYDQNLEQNLLSSIENIKKDRSEEDVLYEILLKYGIDLNMPIEEKIISDKRVFSIGFGALITCLDNEITLDIVEGIGKLKEELEPEICRVVFMDNGFKSDSVKTNAIQILKRYNIEDVKSI